MKTISIIVGVIVLVLVGALGVVYFFGGNTLLDNNKFRAPIAYTCANGKSVIAEFGENVARVSLSDNRVLTLKQISADDSGITFANESGVSFSIKDFSGFVVENGMETYPACRVSAVNEEASEPQGEPALEEAAAVETQPQN